MKKYFYMMSFLALVLIVGCDMATSSKIESSENQNDRVKNEWVCRTSIAEGKQVFTKYDNELRIYDLNYKPTRYAFVDETSKRIVIFDGKGSGTIYQAKTINALRGQVSKFIRD